MKNSLFFRGLLLVAFVLAAPFAGAESFTTNIIDGTFIDAGGEFTLGDSGVSNFLLVTNAGQLRSTNGIVGNGPDAHHNLGVVTGPGSQWLSISNLFLGATGSLNRIRLENGGRAGVGWGLWLGLDSASTNNSLVIDGTSTVFDSVYLHLGYAGAGNQILVTNGGRLNGNTSRDTTDRIGEGTTANENELVVTGQGSSARLDNFQIGVSGSRNRVRLTAGAHMTNSTVALGTMSGAAENSILISGVDSVWNCIHGGLSVGSRGFNNSLTLSDGGRLLTWLGGVGTFPSASNNLATLSGPGTLWQCGGGLFVGSGGSDNALEVTGDAELQLTRLDIGSTGSGNQVRVRNGGRVLTTLLNNPNASLVLGNAVLARNNQLTLQGPGSVWTNSGYVGVGTLGSGNRISIENGGHFIDTKGSIGRVTIGGSESAMDNRVIVSGPEAAFITKFPLEVGAQGSTNSLWILDGATVVSGSAVIGSDCRARENVALVSGSGTVWTNGLLEVGFCSTNNHLVISNGAQVYAGLVRSSVQGGRLNTIEVTGAGSMLSAAGSLYNGNSGNSNRLMITHGGRIVGRQDFVGDSGSGNTAEVVGPGSAWTNLTLNIGERGRGNALRVTDAARFDTRNLQIGYGETAAWNELELGGAGTLGTATTVALGGFGSSNRFVLRDGAAFGADLLQIGVVGNRNEMRLSGVGVHLVVSNHLYVGYAGRSNRVQVSGGAQLATARGTIGGQGESADFNSVEITGLNSRWVNSGELQIGGYGQFCELLITGGARVSSGTGNIGAHGRFTVDPNDANCTRYPGFNTVVVEGTASLWETPILWVGSNSYGNRLEVRSGGKVVANRLRLGGRSAIGPNGSCGPYFDQNELLVNGGCVVVTNDSGTGLLEPHFGLYRQESGLALVDELICTNGPFSRIELNGGTLRINSGWVRNGSPLIVGDGLHSARLHLVGDPFWGGIKFRAEDGLFIATHAELAGTGYVVATVTNAGTVSPGVTGPGILSMTHWRSLPGSTLRFDIAGANAGQSDHVHFDGPGALGGLLAVAVHGDFVPSPTNVFQIIAASGPLEGAFENVAFGGRVKTINGLGSFLVASNDNRIELRDYLSLDTDGDGIEDAWANTHFGHSPLSQEEQAGDMDNDGLRNADEFAAGTDPTNSSSVLQVSVTHDGSRATLEFPCLPGKAYQILISPDLKTWSEVSEPTFTYSGPNACAWTDDGKETGESTAGSWFYRVRVQ